MTKHLRLFMLMLLALVCMGGYSAVGDTYKLVTSVDELKAGDVIVIGCSSANEALSTTVVSKRCKGVAVTISNGVLSYTEETDVAELILEADADQTTQWFFKTSDEKYLTPRANNNLQYYAKTQAYSATISINNTGNATICFPTQDKSRCIRKNGTYGFAHYGTSTGSAVQIYKKEASGKTPTTTTFGTNYDGKTFTFVDGVLEGFSAPKATCTTAGSMTYTSSDEDIVKVDTNGQLSFTGTKFGTATITATFTPTDAATYETSSASYKVSNYAKLYTSIADLKKDITSTEADFLLNLTDAVVTYVNGNNAYMQDATAGILVYIPDHGLTAGDKLTGKVAGKAKLYNNGLAEITAWTPDASLVKTAGADIPVEEVTLAELTGDNYANYESKRVKVIGVTVTSALSNRNAEISQNGTTMAVRAGVSSGLTMTANQVLDIIGYPGIYNATKQLNVWEQADITEHKEADKKDAGIAFKEADKTVELKEDMIELSSLITNPNALMLTYTSSDKETAEIEDGIIYMYKEGEVTITAAFTGNAEYNAATATLKLTIADSRQDAGLKFEKDSYTADINEMEFNGAKLNNPDLKVIYSISPENSDVKIDETGKVRYALTEEATFTVTAKFAGNDTYKPATASYTLTIGDPNYETKVVTFDATVDKGKTASTDADKMSKGQVTISSTSAAFNPNDKNDYRFYGSGTNHTFATAAGYIIKIEFKGDDAKNPLTNIKLKDEKNGTFTSEQLKATWTGEAKEVAFTTTAQARATKIIVTIKAPVAKDYGTLDEDAADNSGKVQTAWDNVNITLKRTLYADGGWNTLCLPFSLTAEQAEEAFGTVTLRQIDADNSKDNTITFKEATTIEAGVPYLIKVAKVAKDNTYNFTGVKVTGDGDLWGNVQAGNAEFVGNFDNTQVSELTKSGIVACLGADNKLFRAETDSYFKGFRAYFLLPEAAQTEAIKVVIDGTATGIGDLQIDGARVNGRVYNLAGQCVGTSLDNLKAGVYIQNGKKVIKK